jgi:TatD DNase family protein
LAKKYHLPLFLHSRAAHNDLVQILREEGFGEDGGRAVGGRGGVVHSFTGPVQEAVDYVCARGVPAESDVAEGIWPDQDGAACQVRSTMNVLGLTKTPGYLLSVNGCSLKTEENLAAIKTIDLQRIMFETGTSTCTVVILTCSHTI